MKKYIVNYIFVCLVILIVTSLLYIVNNDIEEYLDPNAALVDITHNILDSVYDNPEQHFTGMCNKAGQSTTLNFPF